MNDQWTVRYEVCVTQDVSVSCEKSTKIMRALTILVVAAGSCAVCAAFAQPADEGIYAEASRARAGSEDVGLKFKFADVDVDVQNSVGDFSDTYTSGPNADSAQAAIMEIVLRQDEFDDAHDGGLSTRHPTAFFATYGTASGMHSIIGAAGFGPGPALGPPATHRYHGLDNPDRPNSPHWLHANQGSSRVLTLGYAWKDLHLEGSAFSGGEQDYRMPPSDGLKLDSRSARLTVKPSSNWAMQFSKGSLGAVDQVVSGSDVRRTTLSSTYRQSLSFGEWESTIAWGRNARRSRETTVGYLAESSLRINHAHTLFGRVERVGSDELLRRNEMVQRSPFKLSKVTVGYFQEVKASPTLSVDMGVLVSRYLVPSHMIPAYGEDPTACMVFIRLKLR